MPDPYLTDSDLSDGQAATPIALVKTSDFDAWLAAQSTAQQQWIQGNKFAATAGQHCWLLSSSGAPESVVAGWDGEASLATLGGLPFKLAEGCYSLNHPVDELQLLGWGLGCYQFSKYKVQEHTPAQLVLPTGADNDRLDNFVSAIGLVRDLINTPTADMLPSHLADEAAQVADTHGAECHIVVGADLLTEGYAAIHVVGRASEDAPRLIDITWGEADHPLIIAIGKGVCFDSGGLDIKSAAGMRNMKKDMGGAATALGLAQLIMSESLPVRLRVLIPAVENAIAGNAYRPGDVLNTYQGLTVEVDNTDAEGRLVLCDALALAAEAQPELMIDFATLTGSARSAVGPEIAAMFSNDDAAADGIHQAGVAIDDPVWRMPLHEGYRHMLDSKVADTVNSASSPYAGAITAALFLEKFVDDVPWVHFDIMGYNTRTRPGRPEGGEAMGLRSVFRYLEQRYRS